MKKIFSRLLDNAGIHIFLIVSFLFYYASMIFFIKPNESFVEFIILPYKLIVVYFPIFIATLILLIPILIYDLYYSFILLY